MHDSGARLHVRPGARVVDSTRGGRAKDSPGAERSQRSQRSQAQPKARRSTRLELRGVRARPNSSLVHTSSSWPHVRPCPWVVHAQSWSHPTSLPLGPRRGRLCLVLQLAALALGAARAAVPWAASGCARCTRYARHSGSEASKASEASEASEAKKAKSVQWDPKLESNPNRAKQNASSGTPN